ncbi:hypothetical protein BGZ83_011997 [Gryganskiella cystojenkinii]|nr:hypothetical protein BGZ83_011997 [Gryganskiella cystojenkinii]
MDDKPPQGQLTHTEIETWTVAIASLPTKSPEIRFGRKAFQAAFAEKNGKACFYLRRLDDLAQGQEVEAGGGAASVLSASMEVSIFGKDRKPMIGYTAIEDVLDPRTGLFELDNIVTRADISKHQQLLIELRLSGIPAVPPMDLSALWQDASTSDVEIHFSSNPIQGRRSGGGDDNDQQQEETGMFILAHKAFVLSQVPQLIKFFGLEPIEDAQTGKVAQVRSGDHRGKGKAAVNSSSGDSMAAASNLIDMNDSKSAADEVKDNDESASVNLSESIVDLKTTVGAETDDGSSSFKSRNSPNRRQKRLEKQQEQQEHVDQAMGDGVLEPSSEEAMSSVSSPLSSRSCYESGSPPATSTPMMSRRPLLSPTGSSDSFASGLGDYESSDRTRREIWYWPTRFPPCACQQVLSWIYLGDLPKPEDIKLKDFESLLELCQFLKLPELFHAYLSQSENQVATHPLETLRLLNYNGGFAKQYLRPILASSAESNLWAFLHTNEFQRRILEYDPSGVTWDAMQKRLSNI